MAFVRISDHVLSGLAGLAGCHVACRSVLSGHPKFSKGRDVRIDIADPTVGGFDPREYRGRPWSGEHTALHSAPSNIAGLAQRIGDTPAVVGARGNNANSRHRAAVGPVSGRWKNASRAHPILAAKRGRVMTGSVPYSLFAIRYSPWVDRTGTPV